MADNNVEPWLHLSSITKPDPASGRVDVLNIVAAELGLPTNVLVFNLQRGVAIDPYRTALLEMVRQGVVRGLSDDPHQLEDLIMEAVHGY